MSHAAQSTLVNLGTSARSASSNTGKSCAAAASTSSCSTSVSRSRASCASRCCATRTKPRATCQPRTARSSRTSWRETTQASMRSNLSRGQHRGQQGQLSQVRGHLGQSLQHQGLLVKLLFQRKARCSQRKVHRSLSIEESCQRLQPFLLPSPPVQHVFLQQQQQFLRQLLLFQQQLPQKYQKKAPAESKAPQV